MNLNIIISSIAGMISSFTVTVIAVPLSNKLAYKFNIITPDIHKEGNPRIPSLGGLALLLGMLSSLLIQYVIAKEYGFEILLFLGIITLAFIIGLLDDVKTLSGITKTLVTVLIITPVIVAYMYDPAKLNLGRPRVPILGQLRLTIVYWFLLPLAIAGPANAVNMLEAFNGVLPMTCGTISGVIMISSALLDSSLGLIFGSSLLGALLGYYPYNKYPSKVFSGNNGSLLVGAALGGIAVLARLEFVVMIALLPHIINALCVVASIKGFKEKSKIKIPPVIMTSDYKLRANEDSKAPVTLTRAILLITGPLSEKEIVNVFFYLEMVASFLALVSSIMMVIM